MPNEALEVLSIKITKAERQALNRLCAKETLRTGEKTTLTMIIRQALATHLKKAT
jgi:hypothetical protein